MTAYFSYGSRNMLAIRDLTHATEGAHAEFGPTYAGVLRRPVFTTWAHGGSSR